jgi:hypothetical protein
VPQVEKVHLAQDPYSGNSKNPFNNEHPDSGDCPNKCFEIIADESRPVEAVSHLGMNLDFNG